VDNVEWLRNMAVFATRSHRTDHPLAFTRYEYGPERSNGLFRRLLAFAALIVLRETVWR